MPHMSEEQKGNQHVWNRVMQEDCLDEAVDGARVRSHRPGKKFGFYSRFFEKSLEELSKD